MDLFIAYNFLLIYTNVKKYREAVVIFLDSLYYKYSLFYLFLLTYESNFIQQKLEKSVTAFPFYMAKIILSTILGN